MTNCDRTPTSALKASLLTRWDRDRRGRRWAVVMTAWLSAAAAAIIAQVCCAAPEEPYTWRNVEIVAGGFVDGIIFSPKQAGLVYARTDIGGAYRWDAASKRWIPLTDWVSAADWNLLGIESLAVDPTDANRVYVAAGTYTNGWAGSGSILRSDNQGRTWQRTAMPFKMGGNEDGRSIGERLAVDPNHPSTLYFGSRHDSLWHSADSGATWSKVSSFPVAGSANGNGIGFIVFDSRSGNPGAPTPTLYAGAAPMNGASLYTSTDAGATWAPVPGQPAGLIPHHAVMDGDGALFITYGNAVGPNGMSGGAVWKYNGRDHTWKDITPAGGGNQARFGYAGLTLDASHPGTVMVSTMDRWWPSDEIFRSTDGGNHWTPIAEKSVRDSSLSPYVKFGAAAPRFGWWIGALQIDPFDSHHVLYGTGATIWGTDDITAAERGEPTRWHVAAEGLEETAVLDLVSPPAGAHLLSALGDIGGFRHDDLTVSPRTGMFMNPMLSNTTGLDFAANSPMVVARVGRGGRGKSGAFSTDGGATWEPFPREPAGSRGGGTIAVSADGSALVWTAEGAGPCWSIDRGTTWSPCGGLMGRSSVVSDRVNPKVFYAIDGSARKLCVSTNGGASFIPTGDVPAGQGRLRATPGREGDLWITTGRGLFHSKDSGATFSRLTGLQGANALGFGKPAPGKEYPALYLVGKVDGIQGVFRSDDTGVSWVRINDDEHQYGGIGQAITGDPRVYGRVYLGTNGRGILYADPK